MRRSAGLLAAFAGELASLALAGLGLLLVVLQDRPVGLGPLREPVLGLVREGVAPLQVAVADLRLRRSPETGLLELEVEGLTVTGPGGDRLLALRSGTLRPALLSSLARHRLALAQLELREPELRLVRPAAGGPAAGDDSAGLLDLLRGLLGAEDVARPTVELELLAVHDATVELVDEASGRSLWLERGELALERGSGQAFLAAELDQPGGPARLGALLGRETGSERLLLAAELHGLRPATLDPALPRAALDLVRLSGRIEPDLAGILLERVQVQTGAARLSARGRVALGEGALELVAELSDVDRERLLALWPAEEAREARDWLRRHVAAGVASGELTLGRPAAGRPLAWRLTGNVDGLRLVELLPGRVVDGDRIRITVDETAVEAAGPLRIDGLSLDLERSRHRLVAGPGPVTAGRLRGRLEAGQLARLVPELAGLLSGAAAGTIDLEVDKDGAVGLRADIDLEGLGIRSADLPLAKEARQPGKLAVAAEAHDGRLRVSSLALGWPGLILDGRAVLALADLQPTVLVLDRLRVARSELAVALERRDGRLEGRISGPLLALDPWLEGAGGDGPDLPPLALEIAIDRVEGRGHALLGLQGRIEREAGAWRAVELRARHAEGGELRVTLAPADGRPRLEIRTDNAGSLLEAIDPAADLAEGGRLRIEGGLAASAGQPDFEGRLEARDLVLRRAPVLARILTLASLGGVLDVLRGRGLRIDRASAGLGLADGILSIADGRASGSELGLTVAGTIELASGRLDLGGTVVPVYTLNRFVGRLPIVGRLLRGEGGVGAFAATWAARGPTSEPVVTVNPLSLVVPGFLRDLAALLAQRSEPAVAVPRD